MNDIILESINLYWRGIKIMVTLPRQVLLFWPGVAETYLRLHIPWHRDAVCVCGNGIYVCR
jgi:hypothetical protein